MRTLHADLTTSQAAAGAVPYVQIEFTNRDGSTGRTYTTADSTNKIVKVQQAEGRSDGRFAMPGVDGAFSMIIRLRDGDNSLSALDFKGMRVDIAWGFVTSSGNKWSYGPPGFVINQRTVSVLGTVFVEFTCLSLWDILFKTAVNLTSSAPVAFTADTVRHALMDTVMGSPAAVISDDGGVFSDDTADAIDAGADDVVLLPATPAVNDAWYVGRAVTFNRVSIDMTQVGVGTWTVIWEYWTGSVWSTLTEYTDDHDAGATSFTTGIGAFKTGELQTFAFIQPSDWATTTINSQGPYYYVRARVSVYSAVTTQPLATKVTVSMDFGVALDDSDADQGDDYVPSISTDHSTSRANLVNDFLGHTLLGAIARKDGFHLRYIDNAQGVNDYLYTSVAHNHYTSERSQGLIIPNKVIIVDVDPATGTVSIEGSDEDTTSSAELGVIPIVIVVNGIADVTAANLQAARAIKRALRDIQQGTMIAPMNCGQEVWDLVGVVDQRTGLTFAGRAATVLRTYIPTSNVYNITIQLGGTAAITSIDYPARIDLMNETERAATRTATDARDELDWPRIQGREIEELRTRELRSSMLSPSDPPTASNKSIFDDKNILEFTGQSSQSSLGFNFLSLDALANIGRSINDLNDSLSDAAQDAMRSAARMNTNNLLIRQAKVDDLNEMARRLNIEQSK